MHGCRCKRGGEESMAYYSVGNEPERIKKRLKTLFNNLDSAYPDKKIVGLHNKHKHWGETVTELYRSLGYPDGKSFLEAYGYQYGNIESENTGRPKTVDPEAIIREIQKKYPNGSPFKTTDELFADFPEYLPKLKTIKNSSAKVFGMPLGKYLLSIGLIQTKKAAIPETKQIYTIYKVSVPGITEPQYFFSKRKSFYEGDYVEFPFGINDQMVKGRVEEIFDCEEDELPCDLNKIGTINRKISNRDYSSSLLSSLLHANAIYNTNKVLDNEKSDSFSGKAVHAIKPEGNTPWACCRGLSTEIMDVLDNLIERDETNYKYTDIILLGKGISELHVYGCDVSYVLDNFPNVKMVMFNEDEITGFVELYYSKSGFSSITNSYKIGDFKSIKKKRWTLFHSPTSDFKDNSIDYTFKYRDDWEELNYVYTDKDGRSKQLGK